jgi:6-phosphogluconolactonase (cycloisomerase 2 family)
MKFNRLSQLFLVSTLGLAAATLLTSCDIVTIDYIFVADSAGPSAGSAGQIQTLDSDNGTGALRPGQPTVSSGGVNPVSMTITSDYANLYVANAGGGTSAPNITHFAISGSGVLTTKDTITPVSTPVAVAANAADTYLYVISGTTSATLTEYALSSGTIGAVVAQASLTIPGYATDIVIPTAIDVLANSNAVFVTAYDQSAYNPGCTPTPTCANSTANPGWVFGFSVGTGGALSPSSGSPYNAGVKPSAIASDPTNRFVYVTDFASNELIGYTVQTGTNLNFLINGPFKTGNEPTAITIDPRGLYIFVANGLDSSVTPFTIQLATGTPSAVVNVTGSPINSTDTEPVGIVVDASVGRFVYTANHLGNSISGFELNADTGALTGAQASPFPVGANPTALASIPHNNHALEQTTP